MASRVRSGVLVLLAALGTAWFALSVAGLRAAEEGKVYQRRQWYAENGRWVPVDATNGTKGSRTFLIEIPDGEAVVLSYIATCEDGAEEAIIEVFYYENGRQGERVIDPIKGGKVVEEEIVVMRISHAVSPVLGNRRRYIVRLSDTRYGPRGCQELANDFRVIYVPGKKARP